MTNDEREEQALDALTASFYESSPEDEPDPLDDPEILDEADRRGLADLGKDLVDRLLTGEAKQASDPGGVGPVPWDSHQTFAIPPEVTALHRGDELLTPEALEELERHRRELLDDEFDDCEE